MQTFAVPLEPVTDTALRHPVRPRPADESALAPLRGRVPCCLDALAGSQLVIWMNTVGAVTVIAALSDSPTLIALVADRQQRARPSCSRCVMGSMADIVDRRRFAIASQGWMLALGGRARGAHSGRRDHAGARARVSRSRLGAGMATTFVIYQALTQDFVPRSELLAAVALNGVAINLARAVGPALAGPSSPL